MGGCELSNAGTNDNDTERSLETRHIRELDQITVLLAGRVCTTNDDKTLSQTGS